MATRRPVGAARRGPGIIRRARFDAPAQLADEVPAPLSRSRSRSLVAGSRLRPPVAPPSSLKRFLKFQKLPGSALAVVRRAIEDDDEFPHPDVGVATVELAG